MSNDFLSQEEINSLLNGDNLDTTEKEQRDKGQEDVLKEKDENNDELLSNLEKDVLGEIGNISMSSASTALSTSLNQSVNITTSQVSIAALKNLKDVFKTPNLCFEVEFTSGITCKNMLIMKVVDAKIIANLMMGGDGNVSKDADKLSEIEKSAVLEAINQMIGSASTSISTMISKEINMSTPKLKTLKDSTLLLDSSIDENENIAKISFRLIIGDLIDSEIIQILPLDIAKKIVGIIIDFETKKHNQNNDVKENSDKEINNELNSVKPKSKITEKSIENTQSKSSKVEVKKAIFDPLESSNINPLSNNIDLILDVPLEISAVLGKTKMTIKEILNLGVGSLIELDKLAEEPVEILVNGKTVAYGEVVVVDENFGVRITNIVNNAEKIKSLGK